jgi:hypothetical protein
LLHSFVSSGGKVTSAVSGKTDILIVGKDPGFSKVSKSKEKGIQLVALKDLKDALEGGRLEDAPAPQPITNFSSGYEQNSLALGASDEALALASGVQAPRKLKAAPSLKRLAEEVAGEENVKVTKKKSKKKKKKA